MTSRTPKRRISAGAPMRIAVLGAGGFIGSHLVPALLARFGCEIDAVDVDFAKLERPPTRACAASRRASSSRAWSRADRPLRAS